MELEMKILLEKLYSSVQEDDFIRVSYDVVDQLEKYKDKLILIEPIFRLMESFPDIDFGNPGPLVHFIESADNGDGEYEVKLLESLTRKPTTHTVWLLNRIINVSKGEKKKMLLDALIKITKALDIESDVLSAAQDYLEYQNKH